MSSKLKERIKEATVKSLTQRNRYSDQVTAQLTDGLKEAQDQIVKSILKYRTLGSLSDQKLVGLKGLEKLKTEIDEVLAQLKREQTLLFRKSTPQAFKKGIRQGIQELALSQMPFYEDLTEKEIDALSTKVFTIIDTNALDFMIGYNVTLASDVHRELSDGIKRTILSGIMTGKSSDDIVRDMGSVIIDKESFRQAGTKVFSKAQYRMEMIARTEVLRAHNMGRMKFHDQVGVKKLQWLAMEDERMCSICGAYDGKSFSIDQFPSQPAHPHCRCTNIASWPLSICGDSMDVVAKKTQDEDSCLLSPEALENQAKEQAKEQAQLKQAFEQGSPADLSLLSLKQLQLLAKQNSVAIARTKSDFISLLDQAQPGIDHSDLAGNALTAKLKEYKISLLRSKDELVQLLSQKQAQLKEAQILAAVKASLPPSGGLNEISVVQLKKKAQEQGVSLIMTKQETIELLDQLEPGVNHKDLMGKDLAEVKQKYGIGIHKSKQQLIKALEKKATSEMALEIKKQAYEQGREN